MFYFRLICVLRPSVSASKLSSPACHSPRGFLISLCSNDYFFVIPTSCRWHLVQSFCDHPCLQASFHPRLAAKSLRRDGDSNPGNPFGVYTLSRRASSTTRASLLTPKTHFLGYPQRGFFKIGYKITTNYSYTQVFWQLFFILLHFFVDYLHISKKNTTFAPRINEKFVND